VLVPSIRDDIEKEHAFMGLCAMVKLNPSGAVPAFKQMCEAIGSWHEIHSVDLRQDLAQILSGFKQVLLAAVCLLGLLV
jgi:transportin-1